MTLRLLTPIKTGPTAGERPGPEGWLPDALARRGDRRSRPMTAARQAKVGKELCFVSNLSTTLIGLAGPAQTRFSGSTASTEYSYILYIPSKSMISGMPDTLRC
jgi:hypothetical protein